MGDDSKAPPICDRRRCEARATFLVVERYLEETGKGAVEARAALCTRHADEESPTNLDAAFPEYVFRVEPLSGGAPDQSG
jgi:hypothetical protein